MSTDALSPAQFGDPSTIPAPFGTQPIPQGMVRFHHYTRSAENLPDIKEHGLLERYAQESYAHGGTESPETFATAGAPSKDWEMGHNYVEGYANPAWRGQLNVGEGREAADLEARHSTITFRGDIPAKQIVATHQPWHEHARYMAHEGVGKEPDPVEPYATGSVRSQVARGEFDWMEKQDAYAREYGPAVRAVKVMNAATVMSGGKL